MSDFSLLPEQMRKLGYRIIDEVVEHWATLRDKPAMRVSGRDALEAALREPMPAAGAPFDEVLEAAIGKVFTSVGHINHPRFFGFIPTPSNFVSTVADMLATGYNPFCGTWIEGSGSAVIELVTIEWLREVLGMPEGTGGLYFSGGSMANLTALIAVRESKPGTDRTKHVLYGSDQTHSSVIRAARIAGYEASQFRRLASDGQYRIDVDSLRRSVAEDRASGLIPAGVVANAGATNSGAVDPLRELGEWCSAEDLWLHVDGAYGAAAAFAERGARLLDGIGLADSVTLDPHKWLFQPYPMGCLLVKRPAVLRDFFHVLPEYLRDTETQRGEVNFCDYGPELTRPFRALKLWFSLKVFGADAFRRAIDRGFEMAEEAERVLRSDPRWEIVSAATMAIVCFRYRAPGLGAAEVDRLQTEIAHAAAMDGCCFLSTTALNGRTVLRLCTIQPDTTLEDVRLSVECIGRFGEGLFKGSHAKLPGE